MERVRDPGMVRRAVEERGGEVAAAAAPGGLERILRHRFERPELLTLALTHRSYVYDAIAFDERGEDLAGKADPSQDNEQLEFVGDAALGLLAAEALYRRFPGSREGELTRLRASVVSRKHLGEVGMRLGLGRWLRLGHTAEKNAGRSNAALCANAMEALIAALYLDGGLEAARRFVEEEVLAGALPSGEATLAESRTLNGWVGDHKSALQELLQAEGMGRPQYRVVSETGPDHRRLFKIEVWMEGGAGGERALAAAEGTTKKQAQQEAARLAMVKLRGSREEAGRGGAASEGSGRSGATHG